MTEEKVHNGRQDGFERTFSVDLNTDAVWQVITGQIGANGWYHLAGFEADCSPLEVDPGRLLRVKKEEEPCKGTEIVIRLDERESGTSITVTQSGFGPWLPNVIETFGLVWNIIVADLKLFIETGIALKTHLFADPAPRASFGCNASDSLSGLLVMSVDEDGFCARAGIQPGDLLLKLGSVRLLNNLQLMSLMAVSTPGQPQTVEWARGRESMSASAPL